MSDGSLPPGETIRRAAVCDDPTHPEGCVVVVLPLFVYGSLRDPHVRARVLGERADLTTISATLRSYARQLVPSFDYPFIVPATPDDRVEGEIILGLIEADYAILDRYEDVEDGLYVRITVSAETAGGQVNAWAYLKGPNAPS